MDIQRTPAVAKTEFTQAQVGSESGLSNERLFKATMWCIFNIFIQHKI